VKKRPAEQSLSQPPAKRLAHPIVTPPKPQGKCKSVILAKFQIVLFYFEHSKIMTVFMVQVFDQIVTSPLISTF